MADLQEELQAILGDPQAMGQITAIARAITGGGSPPIPPAPPPQDMDYVPVEDSQIPPSAGGSFNGLGDSAPPQSDPPTAASPPDLSSLTGLLGGGLDLDPKLLQIMLRVYSAFLTCASTGSRRWRGR